MLHLILNGPHRDIVRDLHIPIKNGQDPLEAFNNWLSTDCGAK
jgi:hypothetical protein